MHSADGAVTIVFNGEIYNFRELRDELSARQHRFMTASDTEVIIAAYREWGPDSVSRLRGMFAFALWDAERERLVLARDRFGKKPLYLCRQPDAAAVRLRDQGAAGASRRSRRRSTGTRCSITCNTATCPARTRCSAASSSSTPAITRCGRTGS